VVRTVAASDNGLVTPHPSENDDPVTLVARIAESLPTLNGQELERLAQALDELTEAVGLALEVGRTA